MLVGIALLGVVTATIAAAFVRWSSEPAEREAEADHAQEHADLADVQAELRALRAEVRALRRDEPGDGRDWQSPTRAQPTPSSGAAGDWPAT